MPKGKRSAQKPRGKSVGPPHRTHSSSRMAIGGRILRKDVGKMQLKELREKRLKMVPSLVGKK